jgi:hypothetical protein
MGTDAQRDPQDVTPGGQNGLVAHSSRPVRHPLWAPLQQTANGTSVVDPT